jgi:transcriptional antiterminator NusG
MPSEKKNNKQWYMIHTYSGYEDRVKANLEQRIKSMDASDEISESEIIIPKIGEIEIREGQRRTVDRKLFPGYILIKMKMTEQSWNVVRNTPGVTGFVSTQDQQGRLIPAPMTEEEVKSTQKRMESGTPQVKIGLSRGQSVRITDGPFIDFAGIVDDISPEKGKVRVLVSFFGRETPVELDLLQVEKL